MALLVDETTVSTAAPGLVGKSEYTWSGDTLTVTMYERTDSKYGWANDPWSVSVTVNGSTQSGDIKSRTSGTLGTTWYTKDFSFNVAGYTSVSVSCYWSSFNRGSGVSKSGTANSPYQAPSQTFVTRITNNTSGTVKNSGDQSNSSTWWANGNDNTNYAGDSLTMWWDKNSPGNVGVSADPTSRAFFTRDSDNNQDTYSTELYVAWDWTGGGNDQYNTYNYTISADDCNSWLKCMMYKSYKDSGGTRNYYLQGALEYVKPEPSVSGSASLRSLRFYSGTPSCKVWQVNSYSTTNNGYGMSQISSNDNSPGYTGSTNVFGKFFLQMANGTSGATGNWDGFRWGSGAFNANYSLPTALSIHSEKVSVGGTATAAALMFTNWFNPRTGAAGRHGYKSLNLGTLSNVSGTIELPTIDSVKPVSGSGTTVILDDVQRIYTNQTNVKLTYRVNHSGNSNGFGFDARVNENSGTYSSTSGQGATLVPVQLNLWSGNYGVIDNTSDTVTLQHDSMSTSGSVRTIAVVPYIRDSSNYQIFGAANTSNGLVTSTPYTLYKIQAPGTPSVDLWQNTLPAIDGVKDRVQWTVTSPSSWGNVIDFTTGFKFRYKIGNDKPIIRYYEWYFTEGTSATSSSFSGYFEETYDRSTTTTCELSVAATNRYDTVWDSYPDFQSAFSSVSSYNITAKTPYNQTAGTISMDPVGGNHTVLMTEVPFIFTCPNQSSLNATDLITTTTMIIDGGTPTVIEDPAYTLGTANSLTGLRDVTWSQLRSITPELARGAHTIKVECEVLSYFKSTTPVTNNVYLGASLVESPVMDIEVAEIPQKPTMGTPSPAYYKAGQQRTMVFPFTPNDWGCLDTTNNNRHFEYELLNPQNQVISSGTISKTATSWSYTFVPNNTNTGTYTFKLRESTVVGDSDYSTQTFEIQKAIEPDQATITTSQIIALDNWSWSLNIDPGENGSFNPVSSAPIARYKVDLIRPCYNMYNCNFKNKSNNIVAQSDGWYSLTVNNTTDNTQYANFFTHDNIHIKSDTVYTYVIEIKDTSVTTARDNTIHISIGKTDGQLPANAEGSYNIDSDTFTQIDTGTALDLNTASPDGTYYIPVRTKADMKSLGGSYYSTPTDDQMLSRDFFTISPGDNYSLSFRISLVEGDANASNFHYEAYTDPYIGNLVGWTNVASGAEIDTSFTHNLGYYTDGTYCLEIPYERYYTTKTTSDVLITQVIPPEVNISNLSYIVANETTAQVVTFMLNIEVFASTERHNCFYSLDYGTTWVEVPLLQTLGGNKYFRKKLSLKYLDCVLIKAHGANPTDEEDYETKVEMPTSYRTYLTYYDTSTTLVDKHTHEAPIPESYPAAYDTTPPLSVVDGNDTIVWTNHAAKFSSMSSNRTSRGFNFDNFSSLAGMEQNQFYAVEFKIKSTKQHTVTATLEGFDTIPIPEYYIEDGRQPISSQYTRNINISEPGYQTVRLGGKRVADNNTQKRLMITSSTFEDGERVYIKEIRVQKYPTLLPDSVIRRWLISYNGAESKKLTHLSKN